MQRREWSTRPAETVFTAVAGLVLLGMAVGVDAMGRFLAFVAGLGLLAVAVTDAVVRPRLCADVHGVTARRLTGRLSLPWQAIHEIRVDLRHGVALRSKLLEIDAGDTIVLLGRRSLGVDPYEVADALRALRDGRDPDSQDLD